MGTMIPAELLRVWEREKITLEMAMGHLLQNLVKQQQAIKAANISRYNLRADVDSLIAHTGMSSNIKGTRKKPPKPG